MASSPKRLSRSKRVPAELPTTLVADLVRQGPLLLCLDYDGTISEITSQPAAARPLATIRKLLPKLASHRARLSVAVVSGRRIADLARMLGSAKGLALVGAHGLELMTPAGRCQLLADVKGCAKDLARVRGWLAENVPSGAGYAVEDKGLTVALHYRKAAPGESASLGRAFTAFIRGNTSTLKVEPGKKVLDAVPAVATKSRALRALRERAGERFRPVYFGDDLTDEDAFAALGRGGVGVLVGEPRKSAARYRVHSPHDVARVLAKLADALARDDDG